MNIPTQLRALAAGLGTVHARMASKKEGRSWKTWGTIALCAVLVASFAQMGTPTGQEATLTAPTQVPILRDGKQVGSATLPVGAKVSILKEDGENVLIQTTIGKAWTPKEKLEIPEIADMPAQPRPEPTEEPKEVNDSKRKKVMIWGKYLFDVTDLRAKTLLEEQGYTIEIGSPTGEIVEVTTWPQARKKLLVRKMSKNQMLEEAENYGIIWLAISEPNPIQAEEIKELNSSHRKLIISGLGRAGSIAAIRGDQEGYEKAHHQRNWGKRPADSEAGRENNMIYMAQGVFFFEPGPSGGAKDGEPLKRKGGGKLDKFFKEEFLKAIR
jgi:hypothetical protein